MIIIIITIIIILKIVITVTTETVNNYRRLSITMDSIERDKRHHILTIGKIRNKDRNNLRG